ncbi:MAG TPA: DUF3515 domain-containing protein [Aeromicrobium sp.]|nr:DUF3515 domain-containing protein [Aeromicrobium sp.]
MTRGLTALLLACVLAAGCQGGTVHVDAYPTTKRSSLDCAAMLGDLPQTIAGQPRRLVEGRLAGAWGDPPIVVRCGVEKPKELKPTSPCHEIDGVGWLAQKQPDGWLFTTIGRKHYASLEVPADYEPAADALADIADTIARHLPVVRRCA